MVGLKCRDLTYDMSPQCPGCAGVLIFRYATNKRTCLKCPLNGGPKHLPICANININGCNLTFWLSIRMISDRVDPLRNYRIGVGVEGGGPSLTDVLIAFYLLFTECFNLPFQGN